MSIIKFNKNYMHIDVDKNTLDLIMQRLYPYVIEISSKPVELVKNKVTINYNENAMIYDLVKNSGQSKKLHSNKIGEYIEYKNKKFMLYNNNNILVEFNDINDITIDLYSKDDDIITELVKIIRFLLLYNYESNKEFIRAHCASIYWAGKGILLVGHKGAGKTSFFINSLRNNNVKMITNDKALIDLKSHVYGLPYAVSIDKKSLKDISEIDYLSKRVTDKEKYLYWPNEFSHFFNKEILTSYKIDFVLNVKINFNNEKIRIHQGEAQLKSTLFNDIDKNSPYWIVDANFSGEKIISYNNEFDLLNFKVFTIEGNPWKYNWVEEFSNFLTSQ